MTKRFAGLMLVALVVAWVGILLTAGDSQAQLYRYTDKNGRIVFTDNPPPGVIVVPMEEEKAVATEDVQPQAQGAKPAPQPQAGREPAAPVDREAERVSKEEADREVDRKMAEDTARKQAERQRRLEEADRLEREAKKSVVPSQENIDRQRKLMDEAQRLRDMP